APGGGVREGGGRVDGSAPGGGAAAGETRRGGAGATGHGADGVPGGDGGGGVVWGGGGPGGFSGVAESGRGATADGEGGLGRRDLPARAGAEDVPGRAQDQRGAHPGIRRSGHGRGRQRGGGSRAAAEKAGGGQPGAVRDPSAADRVVRRPSLPGGEAGVGRPDRGGGRRVGRGGADARGGADVERAEAHAGSAQECGAAHQDERGVGRGGGLLTYSKNAIL